MRTQVPFRLAGRERWLILVKARIQGSEPLDCAIDTGASHCVLLPEVASRIGVRTDEILPAAGAGGALEVRFGKADFIAVGAAVARDVAVIATDELQRIGEAIGHPIAGILGHSFLGRFRMSVDYAAKVLGLASAEESEKARPAHAELDFQLAHPSKPLVMIPVRLGNRVARFAIDTGSSITVISPEIAGQCAFETSEGPALTGGGGLAVTAAVGMMSELAIGALKISQVAVGVAAFLGMMSEAMGTPIDGILGANVLSLFRLVVDYPNGLVRLE